MTSKRLVIGLTGGIASGKSTVLHLFQKEGIPTISSDELAHACIAPRTPAYRQIVKWFGPDILAPNKAIDRKKLGRLVFQNTKARRKLETMVHPCVVKKLKIFIRAHSGLMVLDIPLLYEAHLEHLVDEVVVVYASQQQQISRLTARNGFSKSEALKRLRTQWSLKTKCRKADHILNNNGSLRDLSLQLRKYLQKTTL